MTTAIVYAKYQTKQGSKTISYDESYFVKAKDLSSATEKVSKLILSMYPDADITSLNAKFSPEMESVTRIWHIKTEVKEE